MKWFRNRIHESLAFAAALAASIAMQVAWVANVLVFRSPSIANVFTIVSDIGPVSGLYLLTGATFIVSFLLILLFARGKDLSHWSDRIFWFFVASVALFLVMTMPIVYQIGIVVE